MTKKRKGSSKNKPGGHFLGSKKMGEAGHELGGYVGSHAQAKKFKGQHKVARARGRMSNKRANDPAMREPSRKYIGGSRRVII